MHDSFAILPLAFVSGSEVWGLVARSSWVAKGVLLVLLAFSVFSWTVILAKWLRFSRARSRSEQFLGAFRRSGRLVDVAVLSEQYRPSPLVELFARGIHEIRQQEQRQQPPRGPQPAGYPPAAAAGRPLNVMAVQRTLQIAASEQLTAMERMLSWLATTGAVTPFIGLFGTVWGIMDAFHGLGTAGAASIRAVAPGISDALMTTAAGLLVAVPAVVFYNHFLHLLRDFATRMDSFALEFLNAAERAPGA